MTKKLKLGTLKGTYGQSVTKLVYEYIKKYLAVDNKHFLILGSEVIMHTVETFLEGVDLAVHPRVSIASKFQDIFRLHGLKFFFLWLELKK